jgi:hypothetical protein
VEHDQVKLQYTAAVIQVPMAAAHMLQLAAILQLPSHRMGLNVSVMMCQA